jgi:hypothetical protein
VPKEHAPACVHHFTHIGMYHKDCEEKKAALPGRGLSLVERIFLDVCVDEKD